MRNLETRIRVQRVKQTYQNFTKNRRITITEWESRVAFGTCLLWRGPALSLGEYVMRLFSVISRGKNPLG